MPSTSSGRATGDCAQQLFLNTRFADSSSTSVSSDKDHNKQQHSRLLALAGILAACTALAHCDAASAADGMATGHPHWSAAIGDLAENEDFWGNVVSYGRYFVSVMLGTAYVMTKPFAEALKRPKTAVFVIVGTVGLVWFLASAVKLMLGVDESFDYVSRGI